jgi:NADH-quinone oxidoreductase subunit C
MILETTKEALQALFSGSIPADESDVATPRDNGVITPDYKIHGYHLDAQVAPDQLLAAVTILDEAGFFIESITGVDWIKESQLEVIYDFSRYDFDTCRVVIRTRVPRDKPVVPTISKIYAGANWHERETHDFFGIKFAGHPHLVPLLLPEDADFHPLLKDFKA